MFLDVKEKDHHQLHAVVANCIRYHLNWTGDQTNAKKWQEAHGRAAGYYQAVARNLLGQHRKSAELLIEAVWHLHEAGRDEEAYTLILQENLWEYLL